MLNLTVRIFPTQVIEEIFISVFRLSLECFWKVYIWIILDWWEKMWMVERKALFSIHYLLTQLWGARAVIYSDLSSAGWGCAR